ncbi:MAG TPA: methyltransferase domain-containing protein, partial [Planctomycetaceae bacterium]|nr:methyltransferase domain-containing protein [Planctomycetaceae bacterium]
EQVRLLRCLGCDKGSLSIDDPATRLTCPGCGAVYPIVNGVPRFVQRENYAQSFGLQWNVHRKTQLDSHTGLPLSRDRLFHVSGWPEDLRGQTILEAGSGAGRFTEVLVSTGAEVLSFDLSTAVDANHANNGDHSNLLIFQADMSKIPVRPLSMDKVICLGVLQHTPDPAAAFRCLTTHVRPGGELVVDVYAARLRSLISWKYALRPLTRRVDRQRLYSIVSAITPSLVPVSAWLYRVAGRFGARLLPIVQYGHLGLPAALNLEWAVLDTFDMYSPVHDHPQTLNNVRRWYEEAGFVGVSVGYGPNGVIARGRRPAAT